MKRETQKILMCIGIAMLLTHSAEATNALSKKYNIPGLVYWHGDTAQHDVIKGTVNGSIILLHDGNRLYRSYDRSHLIKALPSIIESLQQKGYQFIAVPELLGM
jgi:peptidoglycan/xylan/chitin deacetylase (PgdA/CDA1 family)